MTNPLSFMDGWFPVAGVEDEDGELEVGGEAGLLLALLGAPGAEVAVAVAVPAPVQIPSLGNCVFSVWTVLIFTTSIPNDQYDQGPRHPSHMGGDTLGCRVGCSGVQNLSRICGRHI